METQIEIFTACEEGERAYYTGIKNPYQEGTYEYKEFEKGWQAINFRDKILDDRD